MDIKKIDANMTNTSNKPINAIQWFDLNNEYLRGTAFQTGFHRLRETDFVSDQVKRLERHPSGINIQFETNATHIKLKAILDGPSYMAHMTAVAQIGFDLYVKQNNRFVFLRTTKIDQGQYELSLIEGLKPTMREYRLYFPLYRGLNEAILGIDGNATLRFIKPKMDKIVIYGTSISQGGCASRPGMSYSNILDRMLPYEMINLGFSGSAHLELEMAHILNEIEAKTLILEVEANNTQDALFEKLPIFIETLKTKAKIILLTHFPSPSALLFHKEKKTIKENKQFAAQFKDLIVIDGEKLLRKGGYDETVDGVHLTDLGFYFVAQGLKKYLL